VPEEFNFNFSDGWIYAGGRQGFEAFGPESSVGDYCENIHQVFYLALSSSGRGGEIHGVDADKKTHSLLKNP
jgi:hypothetical protein